MEYLTETLNDKTTEDFISINNCGKRMYDKQDGENLISNGRNDYSMRFIAEGKCRYEEDGAWTEVSAGCVLIHFPGTYQHIRFSKEDKTRVRWVCFSGRSLSLLDGIKSDHPLVIRLRTPTEFRDTIERLILAFNLREKYYALECSGYLMVLLSMILQSSGDDIRQNMRPLLHSGLERVINAMNVRFNMPIDLDFYANICYMSRSRFVHFFKEKMGESPYSYQLKIRIEHAKEILSATDCTISECAATVGFSDPSYFSRIFRKITNLTPTRYRAIQQIR